MDDSIYGQLDARSKTVLSTSSGQILLGTDEGLFQYNPDSNSLIDLQLGRIEVSHLYETTNRQLWVGTDKGIYQKVEDKWKLHLVDQEIKFIQQTYDGQIWISTNQGLYKFDDGEWILELDIATNSITLLADKVLLVGTNDGLRVRGLIEEGTGVKTYLSDTFVSKLFNSSDGVMWCTTDRGIFSYDGVKWKRNYITNDPGVASWPITTNIFEDSTSRIWFSFPNSSLQVFSDGQLSICLGTSWSGRIIETSDRHMWSASNMEPFFYDGNDNKKWVVINGYGDPKQNSWTKAIHEDDDGSIWIGGTEGIWKFQNNVWKEYFSLSSNSAPNTFDLIRDDNGILWAGTSNGIYKLNRQDKFELVKPLSHLSSGQVEFHITIDGMLVALASKGLLINQGEKWIEHLSYGDGRLYRNWYGHGFVEHPSGVFWLATDNGLRRIEGENWYDMTVSDGLPSNEVQTVEVDSAGRIWVGTQVGVTSFKPSSHPNPPAVQLTQIDEKDLYGEQAYATGKPFVKIDWRGGDIETEPSRLQYQYNLNGQWSEVMKINTATIGLEDGEHRFSVRALDHHFNSSEIDSITITVNTKIPSLSIASPAMGDIISGEFYVKGRIRDDDFAAFQVSLSAPTLRKVPLFQDGVKDDKVEGYQLIYQAEVLPRSATLAKLDTRVLQDGNYQLWLTAQDKFQHSNFDNVIFRVDNLSPVVKILSPQSDRQVLRKIKILATVSDLHLDSYRLEYTTDIETNSWYPIDVQADIYQNSEIGQLLPPKLKRVEIKIDQKISIKSGQVWFRLLAIDMAGNTNSQTVEAQVPLAIETRKGSTISTDDQKVKLYLPPNTLIEDTIIIINTRTSAEFDLPIRLLSPVYDLAPFNLQFNSIKPATLTLTYDPAQLSMNKQPIIFHRTNGAWKAVGGTPDPSQQTITTTALTLGQYTVAETELLQPLDSARILSGSLTCQPRVFSPTGNSFNTTTTISFVLDQVANVDIKVYSVAGQLVNWLAEQRTFGSGQQALAWDGRDSQGEIVATGLYIISVSTGQEMAEKVVSLWNH